MTPSHDHKPHMALWAGAASILTVSILIIIKTVSYIDSNSASVLASLIDSMADATVSVMTFFAIRYSLKPADETHRHGHGKIEGLAALFQAALISFAGILLVWESIQRLNDGHPVTGHGQAIGVMVISILLSLLLVFIQKRTLKYAPSVAVEADKAHYATDILVNIGVIAVLVALMAGAPLWIDPLFALIVCLYLAYAVYDIGRMGVDMLLDRELPEDVREKILHTIRDHSGVLGVHDLRTTMSGMKMLISFDMDADGALSLRNAHDIAREVEKKLLATFPNAEILIHIDPYGDTYDSRHSEGVS